MSANSLYLFCKLLSFYFVTIVIIIKLNKKMVKIFDGKFSLNFLKVCILALEIARDEYLQVNKVTFEMAKKEEFDKILIAPKHIFLALSIYPESLAFVVMSKFKKINKIFDASLDTRINNTLEAFNFDFNLIKTRFNNISRTVIENALMIAASYDHYYIGTEHLLYALIKNKDRELLKLFETSKIDLEEVTSSLMSILKSISSFSTFSGKDLNPSSYKKTPALDFFSTDLTSENSQKDIDDVMLREKEIERLIYILSRRYKNNPILLGNAGVGKTAIVEGLAKRIMNGQVPDVLIGKKILNLDLNALVAGAAYRGEFEVRLKDIIEEVSSNANIILFIDEVHNIVGSGANSGNQDTANILKPALAKSKVRVIGATTFEEYKQYIEKDPALERRFQPIFVNEPSEEDSKKVLFGIKSNYEKFHNVKIEDEAIIAAVTFSKRYIADKFLPDKAIDLVDEACARVKVKNTNNIILKEISILEKEIEECEREKDFLIDEEDFEGVIEVKKAQNELLENLTKLKELNGSKKKKSLGVVKREDIAKIVSDITSVPIDNILLNDIPLKISNLENNLKANVIGQDHVVGSIISYIKRGIFESNYKDKPLASFMFVGKSGVGKTETAKNIAKYFFDNEENLIRFDMSEYSENIGVTSLIGAPAGYVGYREGGRLTDSVKRKPYSVVLFDDADKAHPRVLNLLLEILDSGHLTDATGRKISFKNTVVIISTNLGNDEFMEKDDLGFVTEKESETKKKESDNKETEQVLKDYFTSEFLAKINKVVYFNDLKKEDLKIISKIKLENFGKNSLPDYKLSFSENVLDHIADCASKDGSGARGVDSIIFENIENKIIDLFMDNKLGESKIISIDYNKEFVIDSK